MMENISNCDRNYTTTNTKDDDNAIAIILKMRIDITYCNNTSNHNE